MYIPLECNISETAVLKRSWRIKRIKLIDGNLYTSDSAKIKVSITCLYYKDKLIGSNNIPS